MWRAEGGRPMARTRSSVWIIEASVCRGTWKPTTMAFLFSRQASDWARLRLSANETVKFRVKRYDRPERKGA